MKNPARRYVRTACVLLALAVSLASVTAAFRSEAAGVGAGFVGLLALAFFSAWVRENAATGDPPRWLRRLELLRSYVANEEPSYERRGRRNGKAKAAV